MPRRDVVSWTAMVAGYSQNGYVDEALKLFQRMPERNAVSWNAMIAGYAQNGHVDEALKLFEEMPKRNVVSWNAMIAGYVQNGHADEALRIFRQMQLTGVKPNEKTFASVLPACANLTDLEHGEKIHKVIIRSGCQGDIFVGNALVDMYAKCGSIESARQVFDKMPKWDVISWSAMIAGYSQAGRFDEALKLFRQMQQTGVKPDSFTLASVLPACANFGALRHGKEVHVYIIKSEFQSNIFVGNALVDMYSKCGSLDNARMVFDKMPERNVVSWNAMIAGYAQNGFCDEAVKLFQQMQLRGMKPNSVTFASVLPACGNSATLQQGKEVHEDIIRSGVELDMYAKCRSVEDARNVFDRLPYIDVVSWNAMITGYALNEHVYEALMIFHKMPKRNVVSWNAMLAGYAHNGRASEALTLVSEMRLQDIKPNLVTAVSVLPACSHLSALQQGKQLHVLGNALIDMYAKCGRMDFARRLFEKMYKRNVVSWNTIIAGSSQNGQPNEALKFFNAMKLQGMKPNSVTMVSVLPAFAALPERQGKWIHGYIIKNGFGLDVVVDNALLDMYAKGRKIEIAREVFDRMSKRNVVSWSAMIAGYAQNGHGSEALAVFNEMQLQGIKPDSVTVMSILSACTRFLDLEQGKRFHGYIIRVGFDSDVVVGNALIDMYAKCGSIEVARHLFDNMSEKNLVSWNAMVSGYGMHGHGEDALALFAQMQKKGMKPDDITFISVLSACSHAGLVDEGWQYFDCMSRDYHIIPRVEHYACMVDLLGRSGLLDEAHDFIKKMPLEPNAVVWGTLLGACRIHSNIELGEHVAERLFELEPENAACYILLSNIYAEAGRWDDVAKLRNTMKVRGLKKTPGCSWIVLGNRVHAFHAGD